MTVNADWREKMTDDIKPRIGFVVIDDYTDDYSYWTGQITFPNPKCANIYWQNHISFIELEPTIQLMKEMATFVELAKTWGYQADNTLEKYRKFLELIHEKN